MMSETDKKKSQSTPLPDRVEDDIPDSFVDDLFMAYRSEQSAMPEECDRFPQTVAYASGELEADEKQEIYDHLLTCRACFDLFSDVRMAAKSAREADTQDYEVSREIREAIDKKQSADAQDESAAPLLSKADSYMHQLFATLFSPKFVSVIAMACLLIVVAIYQGEPLERYFKRVTENIRKSLSGGPDIKFESVTINLIAITQRSLTRGLGGISRRNGADAQPFELPEGATLQTGDHFKIRIRADTDAYCYLLLDDAGTGQVTELFRGKIEANRPKVISEGEHGFLLGVYRGAKTVYALVSAGQIDGFDKKLRVLKKKESVDIRSLFPQVSIQTFHFEHK